jgi:hypothetical protein
VQLVEPRKKKQPNCRTKYRQIAEQNSAKPSNENRPNHPIGLRKCLMDSEVDDFEWRVKIAEIRAEFFGENRLKFGL